MFVNRPKILCGPKLASEIPKISVGKLIFDCLKQGKQEVALIDAHTGSTLTYEQILKYSVQMAYNFKKNGISKGDIVAILSKNTINYFIPVLATLYLGATVQPLNADLTLWELSEMFRNSNPKWVFCSDETLATAKQLKRQFICIEAIASFGSKTKDAISFEELLETSDAVLADFEPIELNPAEDVACIFSSSGTTGLSKCVMLTHYNIVSTSKIVFRYKDCQNVDQGDVTISPVPLSHIYGFHYLERALITLSKCVVMTKFNPDLYLKSIELYKVNKISCPPLLLKFLAESPLVDRYDLSSLEDIVCGSAPLQAKAELIVQKRLNVTPRQVYGLTESCGICIYTPVGLNKLGSCGIPVPEVMVKICNKQTQAILGPNQPGEICIKGSIIMKGYLDHPEETKNCFDDDGFYHTGDVAYYDEDGYIFIIDRLKDLIKYKGFQVAPAELENLIYKHPAISDVSVIGIPDERAGEIPLAFVVVKETYKNIITEKEIVDFVAEHVGPNKRLYGGVKFIQELPKNRNGKTLKITLREMYCKLNCKN